MLMKVPVSAMSAAAALLGFTSGSAPQLYRGAGTAFSVFLLSAGAATLNHIQDRFLDSRMERTRMRPLPQNRLTVAQALRQSVALLLCGMAGLYGLSASLPVLLAGLSAVILYNGLYTPLKKRTTLSLIPGILCGMLSPLIGWLVAGGSPEYPGIIYLMVLFGVWQIPHLWLINLAHLPEGETPVVPSTLSAVSTRQRPRLVIVWITAFAFLTLLMRPFHIIEDGMILTAVAVNALALPLVSLVLLNKKGGSGNFLRLFLYLNISTLAVVLLAAADALIL